MGEYYKCRECKDLGHTCSSCKVQDYISRGAFLVCLFGVPFMLFFSPIPITTIRSNPILLLTPLAIYFGITILYFVFCDVKNIFNDIVGRPIQIKRCLRSIKRCEDIPGVDKETVDRLFVLGQQVEKYSNKLLKEIRVLEKVKSEISGEKVNKEIENIIKQRKDTLFSMVNGLQDLIPSVVNGNYNDHVISVEEDLRRAKLVLDKANKEVKSVG